MLTDVADTARGTIARSSRALAAGFLLLAATPLCAQTVALPPISVGGGVRTSFVNTSPDGGDSKQNFVLDSVRLYVSGSATDKIKIMFNTEYDGAGNHVDVLDAVAQFAISDKVNFWVGRFLPPSDRANMYGPYYAHHWAVYNDGVQDGYPFIFQGRDNGAMYWGQFGMVKVSAGAFDGPSIAVGEHSSKVLFAGRAQVDFWDPEGGYYLNGTYYGGKNLLAVGGAVQAQKGEDGADAGKAYTGDFLLERKVSGGGAFSVEAEVAKYDKLGGYQGRYESNTGGYILGSYLFPPMMDLTGQFEILGKFAKANFSKGLTPLDPDFDQKTTEVNFNYVIKEFNARIMVFFTNTSFSAVRTNGKTAGVGFQLQM